MTKQYQTTPEAILKILERHRLCLENEDLTQFHPGSIEAIQRAIRHGAPLRFVLPAFPCKSKNREKTLGDCPDLGEYLALKHLDSIGSEVHKLHKPGVSMTLCSDGRVFNDLVLVDDTSVDLYRRGLQRLIETNGFHFLHWYDLDDALPDLKITQRRQWLVENYGQPIDKIPNDHLFCGIHRFIFEDRLHLVTGKSRNQIRNESKIIAKQVIQRSNAWSSYLQERFPEAIRLSIHPHPANSFKIGIQLVPAEDRFATPWHNAIIIKDERPTLMKHRDIQSRGAQLKELNGYYYYEGSHEKA